jgi:hypothetical protein
MIDFGAFQKLNKAQTACQVPLYNLCNGFIGVTGREYEVMCKYINDLRN